MVAGATQPDAAKVFRAIAMIISRREEAKVTLIEVRKKHEEKRSA